MAAQALSTAEELDFALAQGDLLFAKACLDGIYRIEQALEDRGRADVFYRRAGVSPPRGSRTTPALLMALGRVDAALALFERDLAVANASGALGDRDVNQGTIAGAALGRGDFDFIDAIADELRTSSSCNGFPYVLRLLFGGETTRAIDALPPIGMVGGVPTFVAGVESEHTYLLSPGTRQKLAARLMPGMMLRLPRGNYSRVSRPSRHFWAH